MISPGFFSCHVIVKTNTWLKSLQSWYKMLYFIRVLVLVCFLYGWNDWSYDFNFLRDVPTCHVVLILLYISRGEIDPSKKIIYLGEYTCILKQFSALNMTSQQQSVLNIGNLSPPLCIHCRIQVPNRQGIPCMLVEELRVFKLLALLLN